MAAPPDDWRTPEKRRVTIQKLEESISSLQGPIPNLLKNPGELEKAILEKSKSAEEYSTYIRNVILMVARQKNMQQQQPGQMTHQQPMGSTGRGMVVPRVGGAGGGAMMPGSMNPRPAGMGMNPMAPNNYQYQGGMGPGQGQMAAMSMQGRPPAPPQHNPSMYGQMPGMVQTNTFVGGQPAGQMTHQQPMGGTGRGMVVPGGGGAGGGAMMPGGMNPRPAGMWMNPMAPNNYQYQGGMGPGQGQMAAMSMQGRPPAPPQYNPSMYQQPGQMPGMVQTNRFVGGQLGGMAMMNNQAMSVPRMGGANPTGYGMMDSGVQPVRAVPNPSYPAPRPPGAPQLPQSQGGGVLSPYNSAMAAASPSQQQLAQQAQAAGAAGGGGVPPSSTSMPSSVGGPAIPGSSTRQPSSSVDPAKEMVAPTVMTSSSTTGGPPSLSNTSLPSSSTPPPERVPPAKRLCIRGNDSAEAKKHIAAIERAISSKGKFDHIVMHGVFLGPARSGKSSLLKRLLNEDVDAFSPSTGVADKVIQVEVRRSSSTAACISGCRWHRLTKNGEATRMMLLTAENHQVDVADKETSMSNTDIDASPALLSAADNKPKGYTSPTETFEAAVRNSNIEKIRELAENSWSLYLSDTGGQMEFQELLPLLVSGPSLFFIIFPLNRDMDELFTIKYQLHYGQDSDPYQSSLTLKEAILQSLATIAAMGTFTYEGLGSCTELKPKVLFVGTHKDTLDPTTKQEKIMEIDDHLQTVIRKMSHYREGLVEFASSKQMMFAVNNLDKDDSDFALIRARVGTIAARKSGGYQMCVPTHWFIFSITLRQLTTESRVVSYSECFFVAQKCGITTEEELDEALWFLHTKMGVVRHFPHGELRNIVLIDPQLLFDKVTELIVKTFTFEKVGKQTSDSFKNKGIFSLKDFEEVDMGSDANFMHSHFINLLKHLRIVVPFSDGKQLFIPCVLSHTNATHHRPTPNASVPILAIAFDCGYCPKGVVGATIMYLMSNEMQSEFIWRLQTDQIYRDQVSFLVGPNIITLCIFPTHFEVVYSFNADSIQAFYSIQDTCRDVCQSLMKAIQTVISDIHLTCQCEATFHCSICTESHVAELLHHKEIPRALYCNKLHKVCDLPSGYQNWLEVPRSFVQPESSRDTNPPKLPSALKLVFPLASKWHNLGVFLGLDEGRLNTIRHNCKNEAEDCLREVLSAWIKQVDPPPSWSALAVAVETFNPSIAEKIKQQ